MWEVVMGVVEVVAVVVVVVVVVVVAVFLIGMHTRLLSSPLAPAIVDCICGLNPWAPAHSAFGMGSCASWCFLACAAATQPHGTIW